ncbi:hypothetical protein GT037_000122 [Alternaria burnsii]|uniref:Chitin-binding type-1 domain-containing protein n=1 Tax=Alternaria burnsii TaxID=1187904 RepID=A0A8H7BDJ2_9PLEO|nr:uncharacterized protein GT037_000122 [Alternaria burnsii]KAF7681146.1 hypothetical protein GT037_000122 [Alternaria burnsii]
MEPIMPSLITLFCLVSVFFVPVVSGHNIVKFINHCPYPLFFWQVGPQDSGIDGSNAYREMVPGGGGSVIHEMRNTEALGGGLSLKIRDLDHYAVAPAGIIQVEYHLEPSKGFMWYDLSAVDCDLNAGPENATYCPLIEGGIKLYVPDAYLHTPEGPQGECPTGSCNSTGCTDAYEREGGYAGEPSWVCKAGADLFLETCIEKAGERTFFGKDPSASLPVHQAIPDPFAQPAPPPPTVPYKELKISPNGECGPIEGYTCTGSQHGVCCSQYGYCGNRPEYCYAGCQTGFGYCLGENEAHPQVAGPEPFVLSIVSTATDISVATRTTTASTFLTETETETVAAAAAFTSLPVSARLSQKMFKRYLRRNAAAYANM